MQEHSVLGPGVNCYCMNTVKLESYVVVSQGAQLCCGTHDIEDPQFQLMTEPIEIKTHAWIAADAFIGPGVTVGEGAVVGARAVLFKDAEAFGVYVGNPAVRIKKRVFRMS
jgi:putative colanic acid biosynthesis acetyltransferase WcaF